MRYLSYAVTALLLAMLTAITADFILRIVRGW